MMADDLFVQDEDSAQPLNPDMYLLSPEEVRQMDRYTIEELGLPGAVLMENAGAQVAERVLQIHNEQEIKFGGPDCLVLAGKGNNGGDGCVIARRLADAGLSVILCLVAEPEELKGDAKLHYEVYRRRKLPLFLLGDHSLAELYRLMEKAPVIVDALLGTGINREVKSPYKEIIAWLNRHRENTHVVAVDIPSGLCAETGRVLGDAVRATHTVTFVSPKRGFFLLDGPLHIGQWEAVDISVPPALVKALDLDPPALITKDLVRQALPLRPPHGHKGTFGHVLVVGGSTHYCGAPLFAAQAALRGGAGLVTLAIPDVIHPYLASQSPETIFLPLPTERGVLGERALHLLLDKLSAYDVLVVGPGLGSLSGGAEWLVPLISQAPGPTVVDADGLNLLKEWLRQRRPQQDQPLILTPHPGEMARLSQMSVGEVERDRLGLARRWAKEHGDYMVLKGHRTVLAVPEGRVWVNPRGHSALAKGGSGDILAGLIAAFLAQGADAERAVIAALYLHALAGEKAAQDDSEYSVLPTDLINALGPALRFLLSRD